MIKVVTLRCNGCGKTYTYEVGADQSFATWLDVAAGLSDQKEYEKLLELYSKISENKTKLEMQAFGMNYAESLYNIPYDACGEETVKLLDFEDESQAETYFGEKAKESILPSREKWESLLRHEGVIAFKGMYLCPKTHNVKQGVHLSMRWHDGGKLKTYTLRNGCPDCSATMTLLDDGNLGFMHEDCPTVGRCECKSPLVVDKVSFRIPTHEAK